MTDELLVHRTAGVATVTLHRPSRRNALSAALVLQLERLLQQLDLEPGIGCLVLAGSAPGFCAGSDLKELALLDLQGMASHESRTARVARSIGMMRRPVLAAVDGFAMGGGFCLAAACDLVVTSPHCKWHLPEVQIGWIPPWGLESLVHRCGAVTARRLTWGDSPIDGTQAQQLGVADIVVPAGQVDTAAHAHAVRLAALPPIAVAATKRYFARHLMARGEAQDQEANHLFADNCQHEAARTTLRRYRFAGASVPAGVRQ